MAGSYTVTICPCCGQDLRLRDEPPVEDYPGYWEQDERLRWPDLFGQDRALNRRPRSGFDVDGEPFGGVE